MILILTIVASIVIFGQAFYLTLVNNTLIGVGLLSLILATMVLFFRTDFNQREYRFFKENQNVIIDIRRKKHHRILMKNFKDIDSINNYIYFNKKIIKNKDFIDDISFIKKHRKDLMKRAKDSIDSNYERYIFRESSFPVTLHFKTLESVIMYYSIVGFFSVIALVSFTPPISLAWHYIAFFWLTLIGTCSVFWLVGKRRERKAQNPLNGLIETGKARRITAEVNENIRAVKQAK